METLTEQQRQDILNKAVAAKVKLNWKLESTMPGQAVMRTPGMGNIPPAAHLFLTVFTVGVWIPIAITLAILVRPQQRVLTVTPDGRVTIR